MVPKGIDIGRLCKVGAVPAALHELIIVNKTEDPHINGGQIFLCVGRQPTFSCLALQVITK